MEQTERAVAAFKDSLDTLATVKLADGREKLFSVFRFRRYDPPSLIRLLDGLGWETVAQHPYGPNQEKPMKTLLLFRRAHPYRKRTRPASPCEPDHQTLKTDDELWAAAPFAGIQLLAGRIGECRHCRQCGSALVRPVSFLGALFGIAERHYLDKDRHHDVSVCRVASALLSPRDELQALVADLRANEVRELLAAIRSRRSAS